MSCDYCDERAGIETVYNQIYGQRNRMVCETRRFTVFPCMGQLREGHLLIASKKHVNAAGMLGRDAILELENVISAIGDFYQKQYQQGLLCFEHGVLNDEGSCGGCGIYHMHLHVLPASFEEFSKAIQQVRSQEGHIISSAEGLFDTRRYVERQKTYLFLSYHGEGTTPVSYIAHSRGNYFESQYMRKIICSVLGRTNWDWRSITWKETEFFSTMEKCRAFFGGQPAGQLAGNLFLRTQAG